MAKKEKTIENQKDSQLCNEEQLDKEKAPEENENPNMEDDAQNELLQKIDDLSQELLKQKDLFMRTSAEYANFRTRSEKEKLEIYTNATVDAIKNLLPVADSLELALGSCSDVSEDYKKGLELVKSQLDKALLSLSVESFGEVGESFDPSIHNAIARIDDESLGENTISLVFQKGYRCKDKIIRYCMVQVANG